MSFSLSLWGSHVLSSFHFYPKTHSNFCPCSTDQVKMSLPVKYSISVMLTLLQLSQKGCQSQKKRMKKRRYWRENRMKTPDISVVKDG